MGLITQPRLLLLLLSISTINVYARMEETLLQMVIPNKGSHFNGRNDNDLYCAGWRVAVEANNVAHWEKIPDSCSTYVFSYMHGKPYRIDSKVVADESISFAETVTLSGDGKDVWIFDIDETLLSSLQYYSVNGHRSNFSSATLLPDLPESLRLYKILLRLGFKFVFLTGRDEGSREITEENLLFAGYYSWERLILRQPSDIDVSALVYKSKKRAELVAQGYRIHGNSGDQWSDLLGFPVATRSFKLPNPLYHVE